jgi:DNA-binding response OmpR family regulator
VAEERILVLLSDQSLLTKVVKVLRIEGHRVRGVDAKEDLLSLIGEETFDIVISDWMLGVTPGVKVFKRIQEAMPGVRGIFVTDHGGREVVTEALAAGAAGVLIRPFTPQALLSTIRQALTRDGERILVVDDDPAVISICVDALRQDGYQAVGVRSGEAAVSKFSEEPFDLVLLDWRMPGMDGVETFRALREIRKDVNAVMITGHGTPQVLSQVIKEGMAGFLIKPFTHQALSATIEKVLRQRRGGQAQGAPTPSMN